MRASGLACGVFGLIVVLGPSSGAATSNMVFTAASFPGVGEARPAVWTITPLPGDRGFRILVECSGFSAVPVAGGYSLRIPGQASTAVAGFPDVPSLARVLPRLCGSKPSLVMHGSNSTNVTDVVLAPAESFKVDAAGGSMRVLRPFRQRDPSAYGRNDYWPPELVKLEIAAIGTQYVVRVECFPVQYNPVEKVVRFYRRMEGVLQFEDMEGQH